MCILSPLPSPDALQIPRLVLGGLRGSGAPLLTGPTPCAPLLLLPLQAFAAYTEYRAWVRYDGAINMLQLFIGTGTTRPQSPVLVSRVNITQTLGTNQAFPGFTGGAWGSGGEYQNVYSLSFQTGGYYTGIPGAHTLGFSEECAHGMVFRSPLEITHRRGHS